jgi:nitrite reductase/ring-hydroxylating ferredoxin subunit
MISNLNATGDGRFTMSDFVDVAAASEIPEGEILGVRVLDEPVVLGKLKGTIHAIGGMCTHEDALLEDGELDGQMVRCPLHDSGFNIHTGKAVHLPAVGSVPVYEVKVVNGRVLVSSQPKQA